MKKKPLVLGVMAVVYYLVYYFFYRKPFDPFPTEELTSLGTYSGFFVSNFSHHIFVFCAPVEEQHHEKELPKIERQLRRQSINYALDYRS